MFGPVCFNCGILGIDVWQGLSKNIEMRFFPTFFSQFS